MLIPVDDGSLEIPGDVKDLLKSEAEAVKSGGPRTESVMGPAARSGTLPLERWKVMAHTYTEDMSSEMSIFGALFSGKAERVKAGVIHEAKRFTVTETPKGRKVEMGVAVRLSVATLKLNGKAGVSLPNLAAEAQLGTAEAKIGISVLGFTGAFGDTLPAPAKLDVESFGVYMDAFRKIQGQVFAPASSALLVPTLLGYHAVKDD